MVVKKWLGGLAIVALVGGIGVGVSKHVFAEGSSGTSDGGTDGSDQSCTTGICYGHSRGGGWAQYEVDSDTIEIAGETIGEREFIGGTLSNCQSIGATNYLRLAPALFNSEGESVRQLGLMTVGTFSSEGWTYNMAVGGISQADAYKAFLAGDAADGTRDGKISGNTWSDTSAFCYKPGDEKVVYDDTTFWTKSKVTVSGEEITGGKTVTSKRNGKVTLKLSTDKSSVTVDFSHIVGFDRGSFSMNSNDTTSGDAVTTKWKVSGAYTVDEHSSTTWRPDANHEETPDAAKNSVTIDLNPGDVKTKCSTIKYTRRKTKLTGTPVITCDGWSCYVDHYDYSASYSGDEDSEACVEITRPWPSGGNPANPGGTTGSKVMFAGEESTIKWDKIRAFQKGNDAFSDYATRRLAGWQAIKFLVPSAINYNAEVQVAKQSKKSPCDLYKERLGSSIDCKVHEQNPSDWRTSDNIRRTVNYTSSPAIKVPNGVGDKYCNSFGFSLEYWYKISGSENDDDNKWHHDGDKDYWYDYGAACRTIAKKPSAAVWNGSMMTTGDIKTLLPLRFESINFGEQTNEGDTTQKLFGSWAEYLTIADQPLTATKTMASGSALSNGSATDKLKLCIDDPWAGNSPLTIANEKCNSSESALGSSGINANSTFKTRLNAYLRDVNNSAITKITDGNLAPLYSGVTGNTVVVKDGDLNITGDIKVADGWTPHNTPQVVIFVDGNVNVASDVTQIDAWIIATGTVNTCEPYIVGKNEGGTLTSGTRSDSAGVSNSDVCAKQLVFNGPVIAGALNLRRTFGSDNTAIATQGLDTSGNTGYSTKQSAAEIFNLRADTYLWAYTQAARYSSSYKEVYSRELAPRY